MGLGSSVLFRGVHDVKDVQNEDETLEVVNRYSSYV